MLYHRFIKKYICSINVNIEPFLKKIFKHNVGACNNFIHIKMRFFSSNHVKSFVSVLENLI